MTKIKFILSAVAAVAAVGGAFALKAKKVSNQTLYTLREGDFVAKPNPTDAQNCLETLATNGSIDTPPAASSYYYVTVGTPISGINACHYRYYLTQE